MEKATLVIGATENIERYSNIAIRKLRTEKIQTLAIGSKKGRVLDVEIGVERANFKNIDTVTLYISPLIQKEYYNYIIGLKPRRVIFNPGTENSEFIELLKKNGIKSEVACTLVLLSTNQF